MPSSKGFWIQPCLLARWLMNALMLYHSGGAGLIICMQTTNRLLNMCIYARTRKFHVTSWIHIYLNYRHRQVECM
ncbi:hypothetical protein F4825DRAFT_410733 [Nemania diffusa]|nr:hypothetical protein F4825DRAFT_410733 [Nemania diffusa]